MKKILIFLIGAGLLVGCTKSPSSQPGTPTVELPVYPSTQSGSPAATHCTDNGGTLSYETPDQSTMQIMYCTTQDGQKIDAWQYFSQSTITPPIASGNVLSGSADDPYAEYSLQESSTK